MVNWFALHEMVFSLKTILDWFALHEMVFTLKTILANVSISLATLGPMSMFIWAINRMKDL